MPLHPESMRELRALVSLHGMKDILLALADIHAEDVKPKAVKSETLISYGRAIKPQSLARESYERAWSIKQDLKR